MESGALCQFFDMIWLEVFRVFRAETTHFAFNHLILYDIVQHNTWPLLNVAISADTKEFY